MPPVFSSRRTVIHARLAQGAAVVERQKKENTYGGGVKS